jgi:hypothetical protein
MKKILVLLLPLLFLATGAWAQNDFINGNFEAGNYSGWTKGGGTWTSDGVSQSFTNSGDPGKSAIVGSGWDPNAGATKLNSVFAGNYAARINNSDPSYHFSTISQTVTNYGYSNLYFAWAAVLEDPGHPSVAEPFFSLYLKDLTTNTVLYSQAFDSSQNLSIFKTGTSDWLYTDWQAVAMSVTQGHDLQLILTAADCGYGAHGGYAYLDNIGHNVVTTPEPTTMLLLGLGLVGLAGFRKRS